MSPLRAGSGSTAGITVRPRHQWLSWASCSRPRRCTPAGRPRNHLLALAQTNGVSRRRVDELIDMVGLGDVAGKRVGGFSLGMGQRLGIAAAVLGDPAVVVLDEPVNGLDPEGVLWV